MAARAISRATVQFLRAAGGLLTHRIRNGGRICVITYHRVLEESDPLLPSEPDVATFRWQMELLARCFNVLPLNDAVAALKAGAVPPRAVCITFDDGYRAVHDLALPVLREFGLPATVFVTSGFVGQGSMWNDRIIDAMQSLPSDQFDLSELGLGSYSLRSLDDRKATLNSVIERSKYLPPQERRALVERFEALVGERSEQQPMLTPEMLLDLDKHGIEIGAHTISHPILSSLDDETARMEIAGSKEQLERILGKPIRLFAYPNGKSGKDFDQRHVDMVRDAGFSAAFTTAVGSITRDQDVFQLPRSRPWDRTPLLFGLRLLFWLAQDRPK